jgi:hypothetical protein
MSDEMKKIETLIWMFNNLTTGQMETLKNMALAMIEPPVSITEKKRPPLND